MLSVFRYVDERLVDAVRVSDIEHAFCYMDCTYTKDSAFLYRESLEDEEFRFIGDDEFNEIC